MSRVSWLDKLPLDVQEGLLEFWRTQPYESQTLFDKTADFLNEKGYEFTASLRSFVRTKKKISEIYEEHRKAQSFFKDVELNTGMETFLNVAAQTLAARRIQSQLNQEDTLLEDDAAVVSMIAKLTASSEKLAKMRRDFLKEMAQKIDEQIQEAESNPEMLAAEALKKLKIAMCGGGKSE